MTDPTTAGQPEVCHRGKPSGMAHVAQQKQRRQELANTSRDSFVRGPKGLAEGMEGRSVECACRYCMAELDFQDSALQFDVEESLDYDRMPTAVVAPVIADSPWVADLVRTKR
jgi:hypothetical protein